PALKGQEDLAESFFGQSSARKRLPYLRVGHRKGERHMDHHNPAGLPSVSVYMVAEEAHRVIRFAKAVFHAEILNKVDRPDGRIRHAEFRIEDSVIMITDGSEEHPAFPIWLHVYVADVDAAYAR